MYNTLYQIRHRSDLLYNRSGNGCHNAHKKIGFQYFDYDLEKKRIARNNGELYINSPYYLVWDDSFYYLVGFSDKKQKIVHLRLDRMGVPDILEEDAVSMPEKFRIEEYSTEIYGQAWR
ncbi:MAG: WYL domain-containing protein [Lachnospiraceae bacterium]|nr:WYL domain-containing protein [Lachnospiraceae bacterium]